MVDLSRNEAILVYIWTTSLALSWYWTYLSRFVKRLLRLYWQLIWQVWLGLWGAQPERLTQYVTDERNLAALQWATRGHHSTSRHAVRSSHEVQLGFRHISSADKGKSLGCLGLCSGSQQKLWYDLWSEPNCWFHKNLNIIEFCLALMTCPQWWGADPPISRSQGSLTERPGMGVCTGGNEAEIPEFSRYENLCVCCVTEWEGRF